MAEVKVLFIGMNPSQASASTAPFHESTKSGRVLKEWTDKVGISNPIIGNICYRTTENNRNLTKKEIKENVKGLARSIVRHNPTHVVALGNAAAMALDICGIKYLKMPHPSGLNRKLNDPTYVEEQLNKLREYVYES